MSSGGTRLWKMVKVGIRVEHNCIIGVEVKLLEECLTMESGGRRGDNVVTTAMSKTMTRHGLRQVVEESWQ